MSAKRYSADWSNAQPSRHDERAYNFNAAAARPTNVAAAPNQAQGYAPPTQQNASRGPPLTSATGSQHRRSKSGGYPMYPPGWDRPAPAQTQVQAPVQDASTVSANRDRNSRSYSARIQAQPGLESEIYQAPSRRPEYNDPVSPTEKPRRSNDLVPQRSRKDSVPDRSPLQKLEVTLDDMSKGERRARVAEAEALAQDKAGTNPRRSSTRRSGDGHQRRASAEVNNTQDPQARRTTSGKRVVSAPTEGATMDRSGAYPATERVAAGATGTSAHPVEPGHYSQYAEQAPDNDQTRSPNTYAATQSDFRSGEGSQRPNGRAAHQNEQNGAARNDSVRKGKDELHVNRMGGNMSDRNAAKKFQEPDPLPPNAVMNRQIPGPEGPKYQIPPQTAAAQNAHERVVIGGMQAVPTAAVIQPDHRFRDNFHRRKGSRRYQQFSAPLEDWKSGQTAILMGEDLVLEDSGDRSSAWWEKDQKQRQRNGSGRVASQTDPAAAGDGGQQTYFQPPLYLKCGPLLRYCGTTLTQARPRSVREMWRGSVLIVTNDQQSQTQQPPVLRLFVQPRDLLPPPPAELNMDGGQQLAPEYVDPLAGQVHVSRIGKTLYVRPVEQLEEGVDLSRVENDHGLFEERRSVTAHGNGTFHGANGQDQTRETLDGEKLGKYRDVQAVRLHQERDTTFWRFNIEVQLGETQKRIGYRINNGPAVGFWVPARGESMNIMFHSCNGFSLSVNSDEFCGPDPLWRDVLNAHQTRPFHVMIGGGDQIYNDAATKHTELFRDWCESRNLQHKHAAQFTVEMQEELEAFYCERYAMWFSQGLFGMANSQIPMVNIWDDHDLIDGFGSYPHHFMASPVFTGVGAVAFKYYMLFQHQSLPAETEADEPSWLLGASPGPYIRELSRSVFMFLGGGKKTAFLGLDCRMERMKDEILSQDTWNHVFDRLEHEIEKGVTRHLIVLLGVPIAYPRLNFLENVLTSRAMDPIKALGRLGMFGNLLNKFDGGVEILDDLDDHWTAKHHKHERNWFIQELQEIAAEKSVRVTILGGDVHLAAVGQFFSNKKLGIPKDRDHRYMPNIVCSAIVNTPPPELMADVLNKRNKIHHLDHDTDEDMIPMFTHDVDGKPRNNHHLLPRRNWCSIREYQPGTTPPPTPPRTPDAAPPSRRGSFSMVRRLSFGRSDSNKLVRRGTSSANPPRSFFNAAGTEAPVSRRASDPTAGGQINQGRSSFSQSRNTQSAYFAGVAPASENDPPVRPNIFHRVPTGLSEKAALRGAGADEVDRSHHINLQHGLDIVLNVEVDKHDPAGITTPYRLLVPALQYQGQPDENVGPKRVGLLRGLSQRFRTRRPSAAHNGGYDSAMSSQERVAQNVHTSQSRPGEQQQYHQQQRQPQQYQQFSPEQQSRQQQQQQQQYQSQQPRRDSYQTQPPQPQHQGYFPPGGVQHDQYATPNNRAPSGPYTRQDQYVDTPPAAAAISRGVPRSSPPIDDQFDRDGRPVRQRYRGDEYGNGAGDAGVRPAGHARFAGQPIEDEYSDYDEGVGRYGPQRPSVGERVRHGLGLGYGSYSGDEGAAAQAGQKRRSGWKIWK